MHIAMIVIACLLVVELVVRYVVLPLVTAKLRSR